MAKGSAYQAKNLNDNLVGGVFVALYMNDPTNADIGDEAADYTRQAAMFDAAKKDGNSMAAFSNADVVFPGKSGGYGTITHIGLKSKATGGDLIYHAALSEPIRSKDSKAIEFPAGSIRVTEE